MEKIARRRRRTVLLLLTFAAIAPSCGDDDHGGDSTDTGDDCSSPSQCYPGLDQMQIKGEVICLDRVENGYCTHHCVDDSDCCAVSGECKGNHREVCGPFESTGEKFCFLSCEDNDVGGEDPTVYCQTFAHRDFGCRSTGGGSENRKVCVPGG